MELKDDWTPVPDDAFDRAARSAGYVKLDGIDVEAIDRAAYLLEDYFPVAAEKLRQVLAALDPQEDTDV